MQYCPHCGRRIETEGAFCAHCGKALKKKPLPYRRSLLIVAILAVIAAAILLLTRLGKDFSENPNAISTASKSVVTVYTYDVNGLPIGSGSGFAAFDESIIVTNRHVIEGNVYSVSLATEDGQLFTADSIVCMDENLDIAILRVPECTLKPLAIDTRSPHKGDRVTAIGSPDGIQNAVSTGIFSSRTSDYGTELLMTTASISPGSSGGALFNEAGRVIGITTAGLTTGNDMYFSIPIISAEALYNSRTAADELSIADYWALRDHLYTVDYVLTNARALQGKTIDIVGYLSAVHNNGYLVSSRDLILWLDTRQSDLTPAQEAELADLIDQQCKSGISLQIMTPEQPLFDDAVPGAYCTMTGRVIIYGENNRGSDIRFIMESGSVTG